MAITFPASPSDGDVFTNTTTGVKYIYNATDGVWKTHVWPTNTNYLQLSGGTLTGDLSLGTNDLTAQDITTTGAVSVGTGLTVGNGLTVSDGNVVMAAGHGIDFSADPNVAGMTSELLDDYEEGTWTPSINGTGVSGSLTYGINNGARYTKIGRSVFLYGLIDWSANSLTAGTGMNISGLPFTTAALNITRSGIVFDYMSSPWTGLTIYSISARTEENQNVAIINYASSANGNTPFTINYNNLDNNGAIIFHGMYMVD